MKNMNEPSASMFQYRRKLISMAIAIPVVALAPQFARAKAMDPIKIDTTAVTDVPSLISAMRKAAGSLLPASIRDDVFYKEIARAFVSNARLAYENGFEVPKWILDRLPHRKVALPLLVLGVIVLMISGVPFLVALRIVISAVIASIVLMAAAISAALILITEPTNSV